MENCKENDSYLASTDCIDYNHPDLDARLVLILQNSFNERETYEYEYI